MASTQRSIPANPKNAIDLLDEDHKKVEALFKEFESLERDDTDEAERIVTTACAELTVHAEIEEQIFYPALRAATGEEEEAEDMLDEAEVEHAGAKELIAQLQEMDPDDRLYCAKFTVLSEYIKHHVKEERNEIFPKAKKSGLDLDAIGAELQALKDELSSSPPKKPSASKRPSSSRSASRSSRSSSRKSKPTGSQKKAPAKRTR